MNISQEGAGKRPGNHEHAYRLEHRRHSFYLYDYRQQFAHRFQRLPAAYRPFRQHHDRRDQRHPHHRPNDQHHHRRHQCLRHWYRHALLNRQRGSASNYERAHCRWHSRDSLLLHHHRQQFAHKFQRLPATRRPFHQYLYRRD